MPDSPRLFESSADPDYLRWEAVALALFESFKFNYEALGTEPLPDDPQDVHPDHFLKQLPDHRPQAHYFNERGHVHCNSFLAYGNKFTGYPMGKRLAVHHFTLETYQFIWYAPLNFISNWRETFPLILAADHNYFLESCNNYFLEGDNYLNDQEYHVRTDRQRSYFTVKRFQQLDLPESLLLKNFDLKTDLKLPAESVKTLNFCLRIFQTAVLIQTGLSELFGDSRQKEAQLKSLRGQLAYPKGKMVRSVSLPRLNLLSFLYLSLHPASTALCYGLYRDKYGVEQPHRTAFYVRYAGGVLALKDFLGLQLKNYLEALNDHLLEHPDRQAEEIRAKAAAALDLARMFGLGYKTSPDKGVNIHQNVPRDLCPQNLAAELKDINFVVEHDERSPLWRIFYDYCGEWWSQEEMAQVLAGKGKDWDRLKQSPRNYAVHLFHQLAAHFWRENLDGFGFPEKLVQLIKARYQQLLDH